jgi:hypothetical protein
LTLLDEEGAIQAFRKQLILAETVSFGFRWDEKRGGLNGSTQHSAELVSAGVSKAKFIRER